MVDIGLSVAKYLLFIFNFIFSVSWMRFEKFSNKNGDIAKFFLQLIGVTIIGVSVFMRIDVNDYSIFLGIISPR